MEIKHGQSTRQKKVGETQPNPCLERDLSSAHVCGVRHRDRHADTVPLYTRASRVHSRLEASTKKIADVNNSLEANGVDWEVIRVHSCDIQRQ